MNTPSHENLYEVIEWTRPNFHPDMPVVRTKTTWAYLRNASGKITLGTYVRGNMIDVVVSSDHMRTTLKDPKTGIEHGTYPNSQIRALKMIFTLSRIVPV